MRGQVSNKPKWNKTLAEPIEQTEFGDSSPSRVATDDCDNIVPECPHPSLAKLAFTTRCCLSWA
jgi:hypothetical protein